MKALAITASLILNTAPALLIASGCGGYSPAPPSTPPALAQIATVAGIADAVTITAGAEHVCVVRSDATVACWGRNEFGQLGDGTTQDRDTPSAVQGLQDVVQLASGPFDTCARRADGSVWCWGNTGALSSIGDFITHATQLPDVSNATDLASVGDGFGCAVTAGNVTLCWGVQNYSPGLVTISSGASW